MRRTETETEEEERRRKKKTKTRKKRKRVDFARGGGGRTAQLAELRLTAHEPASRNI